VLEASRGVDAYIQRSLFQMKDIIVDKLAAVPVPVEAWTMHDSHWNQLIRM